ncbi:c-type cytochrome [Massilia orientalis]|uniref:C-type cytochrome n=1 Tax=Massilia orientalis TaxID=3050128 RepID=A0ACC7MM07_9BURK|nr:cytochrome c family protein [Massilia sp. YIM B02787]
MFAASLANAAECASPEACSVDRGRKIFMTCAACHSIEPSGSFTVGPNLRSVVDRPIGKSPGFHYSAALQKAKGSWTPAALNSFLMAPSEAYPGTSMAFTGLKKPDDRAAVIAYLKQLSGSKE